MTKRFISSIFAGAALAMASTAAHAGVTFVFQNPGADMPVAGVDSVGGLCNGISISSADLCDSNGTGLSYSKDGLGLTAEALGAGTVALIQDLAPKNSGLGVLTAGETSSDDQIQMSSLEAIRFTYDREVILKEIDFNAGADRNCANPGNEGPCGTFDFLVDGIAILIGATAIDNMPFNVMGTVFEIVAAGPANAGFTIGSITTSEVPLPGAALLMLSGLAGFGFAGRKRKAA